jgi:hypothetical protein
MYKIVHETPIPPRKLDSTIHPGLSAVIERSLAKAAEDRFPNGAELARALQNYESATVIPTSTLGQPTGDFPGLVDANQTHDTRSTPQTAIPAATPSPLQPILSAPPQTRVQQARHWWQQLSPKTRKRLWVAFVLAAIFLYSKFERDSKTGAKEDGGKNQNASSSSASPAAPAAPATPSAGEEPVPQQGAPALVKRENASGNQ